MRVLKKRHRRWLRQELPRYKDEDGHVTVTQAVAAGVARALHRWHVRWRMGYPDAMVATG